MLLQLRSFLHNSINNLCAAFQSPFSLLGKVSCVELTLPPFFIFPIPAFTTNSDNNEDHEEDDDGEDEESNDVFSFPSLGSDETMPINFLRVNLLFMR